MWREQPRDMPIALPPATPHAYGGAELGVGARLWHQSLTSPSGAYSLLHQPDGDLVLFDKAARRAVWATHTGGRTTGTWNSAPTATWWSAISAARRCGGRAPRDRARDGWWWTTRAA
ncbi:hypothetical protein NKH77_19170 [Streptomyces sp. M19]